MSKNTGRAVFDWDAIEADYRTGMRSNRELARVHGPSEAAIRKRATVGSWERDLSQKVRAATRAKAAKKSVADTLQQQGKDSSTASDSEIIEAAAEIGAIVINAHQKRLTRWQAVGDKYLDMLEQQITKDTILVEGKDGKPQELEVSLDYISKSMSQGATALEKFIKMERQAHNLDNDNEQLEGFTLDELLQQTVNDEN